jgi:hypothetical protein
MQAASVRSRDRRTRSAERSSAAAGTSATRLAPADTVVTTAYTR